MSIQVVCQQVYACWKIIGFSAGYNLDKVIFQHVIEKYIAYKNFQIYLLNLIHLW